MDILVYGLGRSGMAVVALLHRQGHRSYVFDQVVREHEERQLSQYQAIRLDASTLFQRSYDLCIAAPGVPIDHPDLVKLSTSGVEVIGEVEWVYRSFSADIIGITGTAGKTTTTRWLSHVLSQAGLRALAGGNISPALSAVAEDDAVLVTELSSFQLERCPTLRPRIAIILNLGVDHLDRHGSVAAYHQAKKNLLSQLRAEDCFIYNADDPVLRAWADESVARTLSFSGQEKADAQLSQGHLYLKGERLIEADSLSVVGRHQQLNALAVALAAEVYGVSREDIAAGLASFAGEPGRYRVVSELPGIRFIEDSIATRTLSVRAALAASEAPIIWLAGGRDKGASLEPLQALVQERVVLLLGLGEAGPHFARYFAEDTATEVISEEDGFEALQAACDRAVAFVRQQGLERATVLLAPLAASFDQFSDYQERARCFRQVVEEGSQRWTQS